MTILPSMAMQQEQTAKTLAARFPTRALHWQLKTQTLATSGRPLLMGIVNVTPDSFSDGGSFYDPQAAVDQALSLIDEGASIIDIGGESTRPYSEPVGEREELKRVISVVQSLAEQTTTPISIDTSKPLVARETIAAGAEILNDVTGLENPEMAAIAVETSVGVCAMHMQGTPQTMQDNPSYNDIVADIGSYLRERRDTLLSAGIKPERLCLDPGVGFGKTHDHNLTLIAGCHTYHELGHPLLVGHSRKGFLAKIIGDKQADRTDATVGSALSLALQGIQVIRIHRAKPLQEALLAFEACGGLSLPITLP